MTLLPLAQSEMRNATSNFLDTAFCGQAANPRELITGDALIDQCLVGGNPEMLARSDPRRRSGWARDYIRAIVVRDVRDIADVERLVQMPQLMRALVHHSGQLLNFSQLAGQVGLDDKPLAAILACSSSCFSSGASNRGFAILLNP